MSKIHFTLTIINILSDYSSLRLAGLNCPIRTEIEAIEKEMLRLYPSTQLFQISADVSDCPITSAKLGEIDYALAASGKQSKTLFAPASLSFAYVFVITLL